MLILAVVAFGILYRYGPSRRPVPARRITLESLTAAFLWLAMSATLSWYLSHVANYTATYGALGAVIGLMMWMWLSAVIVLIGAKLNAEIEHQTALIPRSVRRSRWVTVAPSWPTRSAEPSIRENHNPC